MVNLGFSLAIQAYIEACENNNILSEAQFAYKAGYGTTDAIFVLRMLLDMNRSGIHLAFIDFSKAFDNVNRNVLYAK